MILSLTPYHNLGEVTEVRHQGCAAAWDDEQGKWNVEIKTQVGEALYDSCDVLINAGGIVNVWRWPVIPGLLVSKITTFIRER